MHLPTPLPKFNQGPRNLDKLQYKLFIYLSLMCLLYELIFWNNPYRHLTDNSYRWDIAALLWSFIFLSRTFYNCQPHALHDNPPGVSGCHLYTAPSPSKSLVSLIFFFKSHPHPQPQENCLNDFPCHLWPERWQSLPAHSLIKGMGVLWLACTMI